MTISLDLPNCILKCSVLKREKTKEQLRVKTLGMLIRKRLIPEAIREQSWNTHVRRKPLCLMAGVGYLVYAICGLRGSNARVHNLANTLLIGFRQNTGKARGPFISEDMLHVVLSIWSFGKAFWLTILPLVEFFIITIAITLASRPHSIRSTYGRKDVSSPGFVVSYVLANGGKLNPSVHANRSRLAESSDGDGLLLDDKLHFVEETLRNSGP
ncbi:hypothetical protein Tco_0627576 [Tanacetum coccineum]|uniref:Uncharacterized protein n=1 Tax=Tanacetum coccineum TaxID=301880 RepID=A0ABQ4WMV0_9ASTR